MKKGSSLLTLTNHLVSSNSAAVWVGPGYIWNESNISQNKEAEIRSQRPKLLWDTTKTESVEAVSKVRPADICGNPNRLQHP